MSFDVKSLITSSPLQPLSSQRNESDIQQSKTIVAARRHHVLTEPLSYVDPFLVQHGKHYTMLVSTETREKALGTRLIRFRTAVHAGHRFSGIYCFGTTHSQMVSLVVN